MMLLDGFKLNFPNHNNRIYTYEVMKKAIENERIKDAIKSKTLYVEVMDEQDDFSDLNKFLNVNLNNVVATITDLDLFYDGDTPYMLIEAHLLDNDQGKIIMDAFKVIDKNCTPTSIATGLGLGFRLIPRGTANPTLNQDGTTVINDYNLISFNFIWNEKGLLK